MERIYLQTEYKDGIGWMRSYDPTEQTEAEAMAEFAVWISEPEAQAEAVEAWKRKQAV